MKTSLSDNLGVLLGIFHEPGSLAWPHLHLSDRKKLKNSFNLYNQNKPVKKQSKVMVGELEMHENDEKRGLCYLNTNLQPKVQISS
jgi:hypothetical protein